MPEFRPLNSPQPDTSLRFTPNNNQDLTGIRLTNPEISPLGKYDWRLNYGQNQEYLRGMNQPAYAKLGNAAARFLPSVALKVAQGAVSTAALIGSGFDLETAFNNDVANALSEAEKKVEEHFPIYHPQQYAEGNLLTKMGTANFWSEDFADGLEFLVSAYVPGAALSKVGGVTKLVGASKYLKASKLAKALEGAREATGGTGILTTAAYNTVSESLMEANDAYHSLMSELEQKRPDLNATERKQIASDAASRTALWNMVYLMPSNFLQSKWFFGSKGASSIRNDVRKASMIEESLANGETKLVSQYKASRFGLKDAGKAAAEGLASEGLWEENIQTSIQQYERRKALGQMDPNSIEASLGHFYQAINNTVGFAKLFPQIASFGAIKSSAPAGSLQDEGASAIMLGGLLGAPMAVRGEYRQAKGEETEAAVEKAIWERIANHEYNARIGLQENYNSIYKQFGKDDKGNPIYLNESGQRELDPTVLQKFIFDTFRNKQHYEEALSANILNDPLWHEYNKERAAAAYGYNLATANLSDQDLEDVLNLRLEPTAKQVELEEGTKNLIDSAKSQVKSYVELFKASKDAVASKDDFSNKELDRKFQATLTRTAYHINSMIKAAEKLLETTQSPEARTTLESMIQDHKDELTFLTSPKNRDELKKMFGAEGGAVEQFKQQKKEALTKLTRTEDKAEKALLAKQAKLAEYQEEEVRAIHGVDEISTLLDPSNMYSSTSFRKFEPRLLKTKLGYTQQAAYGKGTTVLTEQQVQESMDANKGKIDNTNFDDVLDIIEERLTRAVHDESPILRKAFAETRAFIEEMRSDFNKLRASLIVMEGDPVPTPEVVAETTRTMGELQSKIAKEALLNKLETEYNSQVENNKDDIEALKNNDYDYFVIKFFNESTKGIDAVVNDYTSKKEDYDNEPNLVANHLANANELLQIFKDRTDLKDSLKNRIIANLEDSISSLEKALVVVQSKAQQRQAKQKAFERAKVQYAKEALTAVGQSINTDSWPELENFIYSLRGNAQLVASIKEQQELLDKQINKVSKKGYAKNPNKKAHIIFTSILSKDPNIQAKFFTPGNIFYDYLQHRDLDLLLTQLQADYPSLYTTVEPFYVIHKKLESYKLIREILDSKYKLADIIQAKSQAVVETKVSPTFQQDFIIHRLLNIFSNPGTSNITETNDPRKPNYSASTLGYKPHWENFTLVRGILGTGKTKVLARLFVETYLKLNKLSKDSVIILGHSEDSTLNAKKAIKGNAIDSFNSLQDVLNSPLKGIRLIVVDEALAMKNEDLINLQAKVNIHNAENENKIRVLVLGDPSQNKVEAQPLLDIDATTDVINMEPLSIIYRTSIAAIANTSLEFKDKSVVIPNLDVMSNVTEDEVMEAGNTPYGVLGMTPENIIKKLQEDVKEGQRLLIVNTEKEVQQYQAQVHKNVEVKTFLNAQSLEREEVFIILDPSKGHPTPSMNMSTLTYNTAVYTSVGRAVRFAGVSLSTTALNNIKDPNIQQSTNKALEDFQKIEEDYKERLANYSKLLGIKTEVLPENITAEKVGESISEEEAAPPQPTGKEDVGAEIATTEKSINKPSPATASNRHLLRFPTNKLLRRKQTGFNSAGEEVQVLDTTKPAHIVKAKEKDIDTYYVLAASAIAPDSYYIVAVLGQEDFNNPEFANYINANKLKEKHKVIPNGTKPNTLRSDQRTPSLIPNIEKYSLGTIEIKNYNSIQVVYNPSTTTSSLQDILTKFHNTFFGRGKGHAEELVPSVPYTKNGKFNWKGLAENIRIAIFSEGPEGDKNSILGLPPTSLFRPDVGVPYLVIDNPQWDSKDPEKIGTHNPLYIKMKAKKLSDQHKHFKAIQSFVNAHDKLVKVLSSAGLITELNDDLFNQILESYSKRFKVEKKDQGAPEIVLKDANQSLYDWMELAFGESSGVIDLLSIPEEELAAPLDEVFRSIYGVEYKDKYITYQEYLDLASKDTSVTGFVAAKAEYRDKKIEIPPDAKVRVLGKKSEDSTPDFIQDWVVTVNRGPASIALNAIANANATVNGTNIRVTRQKEGGRPYITGKALMNANTADGVYYNELRNYYKDLILTNYQPLLLKGLITLKNIEQVGNTDIVRLVDLGTKHREEIIEHMFAHPSEFTMPTREQFNQTLEDLYQQHVKEPINIRTLKDIITTDASKRSIHVYTPLHRVTPSSRNITQKTGINDLGADLSNAENRAQLEDLLETNFQEVVPSFIEIAYTPVKETSQVLLDTQFSKTALGEEYYITEQLALILDNPKVPKYLKTLVNLLISQDGLKNVRVFKSTDPSFNPKAMASTDMSLIPNELDAAVVIRVGADIDINTQPILFVHEIIHALTIVGINRVITGLNPTEKDKALVEELTALQKIANEKLGKDFYHESPSAKDIKEFVANLSNPRFFEQASTVVIDNKSLPQKIWEAILRWLGAESPTLYNATYKSFEKYLSDKEIFSMETQQLSTEEQLRSLSKALGIDVTDEIEQLKSDLAAENLSEEEYQAVLEENLQIIKDRIIVESKTSYGTASDLMDKWLDVETATKFITSWLPNIKTEGIASWIKFMPTVLVHDSTDKNLKLYARIKEGAIVLGTQDGQVLRRAAMHEIIHIIHNYGMSKYWQNKLRKALVRQYGDRVAKLSQYEYEHAVASLFDNLDTPPSVSSSRIKQFWNDIKSLLSFITSNGNQLDKFAKLISSGYFSNNISTIPVDYSADFGNVAKHFSEVNTYRYAKGYLMNRYTEVSKANPYLTRGEVFSKISSTIGQEVRALQAEYENTLSKIDELEDKINTTETLFTKKNLQKTLNSTRELEGSLSTKLTALSTLVAGDKNDVSTIFNELVKDIFPNWTNVDFTQDFEIVDEEIRDILDEFSDTDATEGLRKETATKEYENEEIKLSTAVKDFLSFIQTKTSTDPFDSTNFVSHKYAFVKTMELIINYLDLQNLSPDLFNEQVHYMEEDNVFSEWGRAVANNLVNLINNVIYSEHPAEAKYLQVFNIMEKDGTEIIHAFVHPDKQDISNLSYLTLISAPNVNHYKINKSSDTSISKLFQLFNKVRRGNPDLKYQVFADIYSRNKDINILNELNMHLGSLTERNYYIASNNTEFGKLKTKYFKGTDLGLNTDAKAEVYSKLVDAIVNRVVDKNFKAKMAYGNYTADKVMANLANKALSGRDSAVTGAVLHFMNLLGMSPLVQGLSLNIDFKLRKDIIEFVRDTENINLDDIDKFIDNNKGLQKRLNTLIQGNNNLLRNQSIKDGDGKKIYKYTVSSPGIDLINKLATTSSSSLFKGTTGKQAWRIKTLPKWLRSKFYQSNTIVNGLQEISEVYIHDMIKNEFTGKTWTFNKETKRLWYSRNFIYGFLDVVGNSSSRKYAQFFYQPSDGARIPFSFMKVLNKEEILKSLDYMQQQLGDESMKQLIDKLSSSPVRNINTFESLSSKEILDILKTKADESFDDVLSLELPIPSNIKSILAKLGNYLEEENTLPKEVSTKVEGNYNVEAAQQLREAYRLYYLNNFVNSYFLNQLTTGPYDFFKDSKDVIKRQLGIWGPINKVLTAPWATPKKSRITVLADTNMPLNSIKDVLTELFKDRSNSEEVVEEVLRAFEAKGFDTTDAQALMTQERWNELSRGIGNSYFLSRVMKPKYYNQVTTYLPTSYVFNTKEEARELLKEHPEYELQKAGDQYIIKEIVSYPLYLKNSTIVLSSDIISKYPELQKLNEILNNPKYNVGELHFGSGVKSIKIKGLKTLSQLIMDETIDENHILEIENDAYGFQFNPQSNLNKRVSNPTQIEYYINLFENNTALASKVYQALAMLNNLGLQKVIDQLGYTEDSIGERIAKALSAPGTARIKELISQGMSLNNPAIEMKSIIYLASLIESKTLKQKFKGGKLILQSAEGIKDTLSNTDQARASKLQVKVENGRYFAEAIIPKELLTEAQLEEIKYGGIYLLPDMLSIRIPTTEIHSVLPIKVVDTYDSHGTNIIIVPEIIAAIKGFDFDVDSEFVLNKETFTDNFKIGNITHKKGDPIGYKYDHSGKYIIDENFLNTINPSMASEYEINKVIEGYLKNIIVESIIDIASNPENLERMVTPISKKDFVDENNPESVASILKNLFGADYLDESWNTSLLDDSFKSFQAIKDGLQLVGIFANNVKVLSYLHKSGENTPTLNSSRHFNYKLNGQEVLFDKLVNNDLVTGKSVWQHLDALINLSVDNAKDLFLYKMNVSSKNANMLALLVGMGMPLKSITLFFNNPLFKDISSDTYVNINKGIADYKKSYETIEPITLSDELLERYIKEDLPSNVKDQVIASLLDIYTKLEAAGNDMRSLSSLLQSLRQLNVTVDKIDSWADNLQDILGVDNYENIMQSLEDLYLPNTSIEDFNNVFKEAPLQLGTVDSFSFDLTNLLTNHPHIATSFKAYATLIAKIRDIYYIHKPVVKEFVSKKAGIKLDTSLTKHSVLMRRELSKYLFTSLYEGEIDINTRVKRTIWGRERELSGTQAWIENFAAEVYNAKELDLALTNPNSKLYNPKYKPNFFLRHLTVDKSPITGLSRIRIHSGANLDEVDSIELEDDFKKLNRLDIANKQFLGINPVSEQDDNFYNEFQRKFVMYSTLIYGLEFSNAGYSTLLPYKILEDKDKQYTTLLRNFIEDSELRNDIIQHFYLSLAAIKQDKLKYLNDKKNPNFTKVENTSGKSLKYVGALETSVGKVYYDLLYSVSPSKTIKLDGNGSIFNESDLPNNYTTESFTEDDNATDQAEEGGGYITFPLFIKNGDDAYVRVYSDDVKNKVAYQKIGTKREAYYEILPEGIEYSILGNENTWGYFDPFLKTVFVRDNSTNSIDTSDNLDEFIGKDQMVAVTVYGDTTRVYRKFAKVIKSQGEFEEERDGRTFTTRSYQVEYMDTPYAKLNLSTSYATVENGVNYEKSKDKNGRIEHRFYIGNKYLKEKNSVRVTENMEPNEYSIHEGDLTELSREDRIKLFKSQNSIIPINGSIVNHGKSTFDGIRHRLNLANHGWIVLKNVTTHNQGFKVNNLEEITKFAKQYELGEVYKNNTNNILEGGIYPGEYYTNGITLIRKGTIDTVINYLEANNIIKRNCK